MATWQAPASSANALQGSPDDDHDGCREATRLSVVIEAGRRGGHCACPRGEVVGGARAFVSDLQLGWARLWGATRLGRAPESVRRLCDLKLYRDTETCRCPGAAP
jgi:hypothetical protein